MDAAHTAISLEVHLAGDCLIGTATSSTGVERPFSGWLGLIAAIDRLLGESARVPAIDAVQTTSENGNTPTPGKEQP